MGMKLKVEIDLAYPDLSMHKHVDFLRAVFEKYRYDVKKIKIVEPEEIEVDLRPVEERRKDYE